MKGKEKSTKYDKPVLLIFFNRPEKARRIIESLRLIKPSKIFIACDGARHGNTNDRVNCLKTRELVDTIDWSCEVKKLFQESNLGCGKGPYTAISWFFSHVKEGIILEDDSLPGDSFFNFTSEMLDKYRDDKRVMHITGNNFQFGRKRNDDSYYFSKIPHGAGFATWKRAWELMDLKLTIWPQLRDENWLYDVCNSKKEYEMWYNIFEECYQGKQDDAYDYQWTFCCFFNNGLSINPNVNLVSNIGWDSEGTHTVYNSIFANIPIGELPLETNHPKAVVVNKKFDNITLRQNYFKKPLWLRLVNKIKKIIYSRGTSQ